ncbi:tape measure protein [Martelella mediterranea]|uniref:Tape measure domain-containing protein n=1 Tax=Martelella mediterranea TaxID=293089 RepID=A0A4R3P3T1_9HYPH|nr:tape measure protein [Martelella mediterranea]TCT42785.1 tape measure domain-containing protein [Martelella mediterranea]
MAKTDLEQLVVQLSADVNKFEKRLAKANGVANKHLNAIQKKAVAMDRRLEGFGANAFKGLLYSTTALASTLSVREVGRYADAWTQAKNALAVAGVVGQEQVRTLDALYQSAQDNAAPITALADLFGKASQANDNLQQSQERLLKFTSGIATALKVEGKSAAEASGALQQLGQLLGSARVQAEEFNSINDGARPILIAVANGLDEAGGSVSKLKQLVNDGKVSGREFFDAFMKGFPAIEKMAANSTQTIAQGVTKVNNALTKYIGETDSSLGASQRLVAGLNALADNFDQTADTVLALAGVIAGALVGRSIAGMLVKLGMAGTALTKFAAAMRSAMAAGSLSTALGGMSAAAGPLGLLIGGTLVGALALYSRHTQAAKAQTEAVNAELERLGLVAEEAAPKLDDVTEAAEQLTDGDIYRKVKMLADEYDRLSNMGEGFLGWLRDDDALGGIIDQAKSLTGLFSDVPERDFDSIFQIQDMARDLERGRVGFQDVINQMREIRATEISQPVADLAYQLEKTAQKLQSLDGAKAADQVNELEREIQSARDELLDFSQIMPISLDQREAIADIIDQFDGTKEGAGEARRALEAMADANPDVAGYIEKLAPMFSVLQKLIDKSREAMTMLAGATVNGSGGLSDSQKSAYTQYSDSRAEGEKMLQLGKDYADEIEWQNSLTKDQLALEREKANIKRDLENKGGFLPDNEIESLAQSRLDASARRNSSGSGGGGGGENGFDSAVQSIRERTAALMAEKEAQNALNPLVEDYGFALEKARATHDLLSAAEAAGLSVNADLRASIDELAQGYAEAAAEAEKAARKNDDLRQSVDDFKSTAKDVTGGFVSDLMSGVSAADALVNALGRIGDKLLELALNDLFSTGGPGLGSFFSAIFGGIGKADGGAVHAATGGRIDATGGGSLSGPGGPRGDKIPAWLSDGEYVINAKAAGKYAPLLEAINNGEGLKLADGGIARHPALPRLPMKALRAVQSRGAVSSSVNIGDINVNVPEGTDPKDAAAMGREFRKQIDAAIDARLQDNRRARGMLAGGPF